MANKSIHTKYIHVNRAMLEGEMLLEIRKYHINAISQEFIKHNIANQYIDNLIKLDILKNNINMDPNNPNNPNNPNIYTNEKRFEILNKLLQKECAKETAKLINELIKHK